jgi:hypothetical protein
MENDKEEILLTKYFHTTAATFEMNLHQPQGLLRHDA